ncbi:MAG: hypothetical protein G01um10143_121 [Parcubacteria group bacterium Gr01-1014_3]|nr:MAG: hypothetical protein G01um10143_121 [Parcubacteria group bacterium Gr01-1014_3]
MKKVLTTLLLSLVVPGLALAAFDDVQLSTGTTFVMSVGGNNLEFTITSGNVESATVNDGSVTLLLATGGSGVLITSPNKSTFNYGFSASIASEFTCNSGSSVLSLGGNGTITVTPTGTACVASSGGGGGGSGGGGSSDSTTPSTPAPEPVPTPTPAPEPAPVAAPAPVASVAQIVAPLVAQPSPIAQLVSPVFNKDLRVGSKGDDVKRFQQLLAQDKDVYPEGLATGYYGNLTRNAIRKFQLKYGVIKKATDSGNGNFGPKTRAKFKEVFGSAPTSSPVPPGIPVVATTPAATKSQSEQLQDLLKTLQDLQAKLKAR